MTTPGVYLRIDQHAVNGDCPLCGFHFDTHPGLQGANAEGQAICVRCVHKHAPKLGRLLNLASSAQSFVGEDMPTPSPVIELYRRQVKKA